MMKEIIAMLLGICLCISLCACGKKNIPEVIEPVETPEATQTVEKPLEPTPALPTSTSEELKLYAYALSNGHKYVVNDFGQYADQFTFDKNGNLVDLYITNCYYCFIRNTLFNICFIFYNWI